jgi:Tfp pilus assembly protein FimT
MDKQPVFSFNELLIAVAIILSIAVVAMPNLLRAHLADSASAVNSTRAVVSTNATHRSPHSAVALFDSSAQLEPGSPNTTCLESGQTGVGLLQSRSEGTSPLRRVRSNERDICSRQDNVLRFSHPRRRGKLQSAVSAPTTTSALFPPP